MYFSSSPTSSKGLSIHFDEPQKAVAPGQVAALWSDDGDGEWCLGCGVIDRATSVPEVAMRASKDQEPEEAVKSWQWW